MNCYYYGGTKVNRTYGKHKNLNIYPSFLTIFGPIFYRCEGMAPVTLLMLLILEVSLWMALTEMYGPLCIDTSTRTVLEFSCAAVY